jgi:hypothetical protein
MLKIILGLFIFCIVLFIYLHIQFQLKTNDDLEVYDIDETSKEKIEEIFDLRQPLLFYFDCKKIMDTTNKTYISNNYNSFETKIRNINDNDNSELYVSLPIKVANKLFNDDKTASYYSENNKDLLEETSIIKSFKFNDSFLRPAMVSNCYYDVMFGSKNVFTPFRYEINYRNFFLLTQGSAQIKISPPHNTKHLYTNYDYENFEFSSPINPWNPQTKYCADFDRVKCLEFTLIPGKVLFLPAYWWYSIKFNDSNSSISCFRYRTYMNNVAILPYIGMHFLQLQNIKRISVKLDTQNIKNEHKVNENIDNQGEHNEDNENNQNNEHNQNNENEDNANYDIDMNEKNTSTSIDELKEITEPLLTS